MSVIYTISDLHLSNRKGFAKEVENGEFPGTNSRFNEIISIIRTCADQAVKADAEALIVPGDVFNERGILPVSVYNASYKVFEEISKKIRLILSPGNHDMVSSVALHSDEGLHSLYGFKEFAEVAHSPSIYETDSFVICMIPFIPNKEGTIQAAQDLYNKTKKIKKFKTVWLHHSVDGAESGPINWKMPYPLTYADVPDFDGVYSGHLHKHQVIGNKFVYVGAPLQHDAGERHYTPGWLEIDNRGSFTQIENTKSPRFVVVEAQSKKDLQGLKEEDYKLVKWMGEQKLGQQIMEDVENVRVQIVPNSLNIRTRTEIGSLDSFDSMAKTYMKAKLGKIDEGLLKYGLNIYNGVPYED